MCSSHLFWLGDLNYRISLGDEEVFAKINARDFRGLLVYDQLLTEKAKGKTFKYFKEGNIEFAPTYKYQPGTNLYERREDKKKRTPAWTDRIQWIGEEITQLKYSRCENLKISDHKPVFGVFEVMVKEVVNEKKRDVYESLIRQLDSWENQAIPKVEIKPTSIDFGSVSFDETVQQKLIVENIGNVTLVNFHFVNKLSHFSTGPANNNAPSSSSSPGPRWLTVSPSSGIIPPGEKCEIVLSVHVDNQSSHALQTAAESLDDILILTLENGRDYFLPIQGEYQRSAFGTTIQYLVNVSHLASLIANSIHPAFLASISYRCVNCVAVRVHACVYINRCTRLSSLFLSSCYVL